MKSVPGSLQVWVDRDVLAVPPLAWERDWFGQPSRFPARFCFTLNKEVLTFWCQVDKPPECLDLACGTFQVGLWEQDVAEFFVMGPDGDYQEFNLSPRGAWWSASFGSYRQQQEERRCPSVRVRAECTPPGWTAQLSVAVADLQPLQGHSFSQARLNPTSILHSETPEYLCYGHEGGGPPDFHRASNFLPVHLFKERQ
jgi:hypothetical protein